MIELVTATGDSETSSSWFCSLTSHTCRNDKYLSFSPFSDPWYGEVEIKLVHLNTKMLNTIRSFLGELEIELLKIETGS